MEVEKEAESNFLSIDTTKDGDIAEVVGEGEEVMMKSKFDSKEKMKLNLPVRVGQNTLTYTPWPKDKNKFIDTWGSNTSNWIGKKFTVLHVDKKLVIRPILGEKV